MLDGSDELKITFVARARHKHSGRVEPIAQLVKRVLVDGLESIANSDPDLTVEDALGFVLVRLAEDKLVTGIDFRLRDDSKDLVD